MGVLFQGVYLLTSIGMNITKQTRYYPVATIAAAATSVSANLVLVPALRRHRRRVGEHGGLPGAGRARASSCRSASIR